MTWFWQQQINYDTNIGLTTVNKKTDWLSPNSVNQDDLSQYNLDIALFDEPAGSSNYSYLRYDNLYNTFPIWNDLDNIKTVDSNYTYLFNVNAFPTNIINESPKLILSDFNCSIPSGSTITGIEVKINKSAYSNHDLNYHIIDWNLNDKWYFDNNITTYTYDNLVTISNDNINIDLTNTNLSKPYTSEIIVPSTSDIMDTPDLLDLNGNNVFLPKGTWNNDIETALYGDENNLWGSNLTIDDINSSAFTIAISANQKTFRSYDIAPKSALITGWYYTKYFNSVYGQYNSGYHTSKIYDVQVRIHYTINESTYNISNSLDMFTSGNTLLLDDTYFKFQSCLNGICYSTIKNINDIYNLSLMTGDGKSINNLYNEYNVIDEYFMNIYQIDIASDYNIDLSKPYYIIDNVKIKPGHLILLFNQNNNIENDIYVVDNNYKLQISDKLLTRESAYRSKIYIKLGTYNQYQFFLKYQGNQFPIVGEEKYFESNHGYILKNQVDYNIYNNETLTTYDISGNTISNPSKILFTNYAVARTLGTNEWLDINFVTSGSNCSFNIEYLDNIYNISNSGEIYYTLSGSSFTGSTATIHNSGITQFDMDPTFYLYSQSGDSILISLTNSSLTNTELLPSGSLMNIFTTIKEINSNYLTIDLNVPQWLLNSIIDNYEFRIRNLHFCNSGDPSANEFADYLNLSPYGEIINFNDISDNTIRANVINSTYFKYFDYDLISISSSTFTSTNQYQNYKLKPFLDRLGITPTNVYNEAYILSGDYTIEEIYVNYNDGHTYTDTYYPIQSSRYKIIPDDPNILLDFKINTFIDFGILATGTTGVISPYYFLDSDDNDYVVDDYIVDGYFTDSNGYFSRTLITEITDTYMLIEKPRVDLSPSLSTGSYDLINVSKLNDISDILYDLYLKYAHSFYYKYSDNIFNRICGKYGEIIKENEFIRNLSSGIIYEKDDLFNLDIFNINIDSNFKHLNDVNLTYRPIELIDVGIDKKTKLPIPVEINNFDLIPDYLEYYIISAHTPYIIPNTECHLYSTIVVDDKLYTNIKFQGIVDFSDITTEPSFNHLLYKSNNMSCIFNSDLSPYNLRNYSLFNGNFSYNLWDSNIFSDNLNNTFYIGYCNENSLFMANYNFDNPSANTLHFGGISESHIFKFDQNNNLDLALRYSSGSLFKRCLVRSLSSIDNYNYVMLTTEYNYKYKFDENESTIMCSDVYNNHKTAMLVKYSNDFLNIIWYKKYYSINGNIESINENLSNYHICSNSDYIYNSIYMNTTNEIITNDTLIIDSLEQYPFFLIMKNDHDGTNIWSLPIYLTGNITDTYLNKMIIDNNNIYLTIMTSSNLKINSINYGSSIANNIFIIKIDSNGIIKWVREFGLNNLDVATDIQYYNGNYGEYLFVTGYYYHDTTIGNYELTCDGIGSWVAKLNINSGYVESIIHKTSTDTLKIKSCNVIEDSLYIGGEFIGSAYFSGTNEINLITAEYSTVFMEKIKITF
ncbi:hypothetical protein M0Q97_08325 [Candidatus Dojkabacteria bacterium]|jgi:hypothetical protein|nr:hypothetical protein [Candidatus Dojkabacteria bacterium]